MNLQAVRTRITASIVANLLRVAIAFVTGLITARMLGPAGYGDFTFLLSSFAAFTSLTDMGMSSAFYTLMSKARRSGRFVMLYGAWVGSQLVALIMLVALAPDWLFQQIWLGQPRGLVLLALLATYAMTQIWAFTGQLGEAVRETVSVQARNLVAALLYMAVVVTLWVLEAPDPSFLLWATAAIYLVLAVAYAIGLHRKAHFPANITMSLPETVKEYREYFFPSVVILGFLFTFLDPWLLKKFAGSEEQGYFAVSIRLSSVALLMTSAVLQVVWKEIAEAFAARNMERVRQMEFMCVRALCFISAMLAGALLPFAKEILSATLGDAYSAALLPFALLLTYPMYQAMHVVNDITLLAIGEARIRSRIVVSYFGVSILASYFLVAPRSMLIPGLQLGAAGLAIKMVVCQVVQANTASYFAAKKTEARFDWQHQFIVFGALLPIGYLAKVIAKLIVSPWPALPTGIALMFALVIYFITAVVLALRYPSIAGLSRAQIESVIASARAVLGRSPKTQAPRIP